MGDQLTSHMPGTIQNPVTTIPSSPGTSVNGTKAFATAAPVTPVVSGDDPDAVPERQRPKRQNTGQRHVRQFSITSATLVNGRKSRDMTKYILLQKTAIETITKRPSIIRYAADAVAYTEQVLSKLFCIQSISNRL